MDKTSRAVIYTRQSSGKEEFSESIEMQRLHCLELARQRNLEVIGIYSDANSSGRLYPTGAEKLAMLDTIFWKWYSHQSSEKKFRNGLGNVISRLSEIDYIILDDITRLARPVAGSFLQNFLQQELIEHHIKIITVRGGDVNFARFDDRLVSDIQASITDNQIQLQCQKSKDALRKLRDSGIYPNAPKMFGIRYLGHKQIMILPEYAACIKEIFTMLLQGVTQYGIMRQINLKYNFLFSSGYCRISTIHNILRCPFYCGMMRNTQGELIEARQIKDSPIISHETWQQAQEILNFRSTPHYDIYHRHIFSGILICGNCGAKLQSGYDKGKEYYQCYNGKYLMSQHECSLSRINIALVRHTSPYCGLKTAILPLLLLGLQYNDVLDEHDIKEILDGTLPEQKYQNLLQLTIRNIISHKEHLLITCSNGHSFKLPRYVDGIFRNMPKYTIRRVPHSGTTRRHLLRCDYEITYVYRHQGRRTQIASFGNENKIGIYIKK